MRFLLACVLLGFLKLSTAGDVFNRKQPRHFTMAEQLEPHATIGGYPIWPGENKWRIWNITTHNSSGTADPVTIGVLSLFQTEGKKFIATMTVSANLDQGSSVGWSGELCKRIDMLYKINLGRDFWNENCLSINHITNFPGNPGGRAAELYALIMESGVEVPPTIIQVAFSRTGPNLRMYRVVLNINPELAGIARETETQWGRSRWHKSAYFRDADKKQLIDDLVKWATPFANQMEFAYQKRDDAFVSIPSWRSILEKQGTTFPAKPKMLLN